MPFINLHTHRSTGAADVVEIVNQYPYEFDESVPFYSIGIHPWHIDEKRLEKDLEIIESKLVLESCLAVGECGLDKRTEVAFDLQLEVFKKQLQLAEKYKKPVIIHCVAAFQELIEIKNRTKITVPLVIHGFSKKTELAKQLIDNGFYLSFGKYLLRNPDLESVFQQVPENRNFLETDSISETITVVYDLAAKYRNVSTEELQNQIMQNFKTVFT